METQRQREKETERDRSSEAKEDGASARPPSGGGLVNRVRGGQCGELALVILTGPRSPEPAGLWF